MTGYRIRLLGEFALIVALALAVIELLVFGTAQAVQPKAPQSTIATVSPAIEIQPQNDSTKTRQLEYTVVLLGAEAEEAKRSDLDDLRGFDGVLTDCTVTYYCCEARPHICGGGTGKTATGTDVTAGRSAAVDPSVIPLGAEIWVDYGDGVLQSYVAEDTGSAVGGAHIDLAVATHDEALALGTTTATVWWSR